MPALRAEAADLATRLAASLEIVGEKDERIFELTQDVADLKSVLSAQAEAVAAARADLKRRDGTL